MVSNCPSTLRFRAVRLAQVQLIHSQIYCPQYANVDNLRPHFSARTVTVGPLLIFNLVLSLDLLGFFLPGYSGGFRVMNASFLARIYFGVGKYLGNGIFGWFLVEFFILTEFISKGSWCGDTLLRSNAHDKAIVNICLLNLQKWYCQTHVNKELYFAAYSFQPKTKYLSNNYDHKVGKNK